MATFPRAVAAAVPIRPPCIDQVEDLQKLQKAAQKITSILDLDQLIDNIVNDVARSFGCVEASIYLHDEEHGEMVLAGVHGCSVNHKGHRLKIGKEGMVGYVASTGQMRYAPDVRKDDYYIGCEHDTLSEVVIPLHVGERLVGVFTASHPELDAFPRQQLRILQALCDHVAVAVYNARRFQSERAERETMSREAQEARIMQQALLPKSSPYIPGFVISGLSVPVECRRRRLVRLHPLSRRPLGIGAGGCLRKRHGRRAADVGYARHAAVSSRSLLHSRRGFDQAQSIAGRRLSGGQVRHPGLRRARSGNSHRDLRQCRTFASALYR